MGAEGGLLARRLALASAAWLLLAAPARAQQCGGEERWAVKMAADPDASLIDDASPVITSLHDLVRLARPTLPSDDETRVASERRVRIVEGRLVRFKLESGKTGDSDFHLVISDETLLYSPGGSGTQASSHSFIAEIPDPDCVAGREGTVTAPSRFATQMDAVRGRFLAQFPNIHSGWNEAGGIRVRLTGVVFFDRPHGQVGRALNGLELHPLLDIEFNPGAPAVTAGTVTLTNAGFEDGTQGWTASEGVITTSASQPAQTGQGKAWLGGMGSSHTDRVWQRVALPAGAQAISLTFFLHVITEESNQQAFDRLRVRVRDTSGNLLRTLATFSNQNAAPGFVLHSFDLTPWRGRSVRISLEATEDATATTSFVVDDVAVTVQVP